MSRRKRRALSEAWAEATWEAWAGQGQVYSRKRAVLPAIFVPSSAVSHRVWTLSSVTRRLVHMVSLAVLAISSRGSQAKSRDTSKLPVRPSLNAAGQIIGLAAYPPIASGTANSLEQNLPTGGEYNPLINYLQSDKSTSTDSHPAAAFESNDDDSSDAMDLVAQAMLGGEHGADGDGFNEESWKKGWEMENQRLVTALAGTATSTIATASTGAATAWTPPRVCGSLRLQQVQMLGARHR